MSAARTMTRMMKDAMDSGIPVGGSGSAPPQDEFRKPIGGKATGSEQPQVKRIPAAKLRKFMV